MWSRHALAILLEVESNFASEEDDGLFGKAKHSSQLAGFKVAGILDIVEDVLVDRTAVRIDDRNSVVETVVDDTGVNNHAVLILFCLVHVAGPPVEDQITDCLLRNHCSVWSVVAYFVCAAGAETVHAYNLRWKRLDVNLILDLQLLLLLVETAD